MELPTSFGSQTVCPKLEISNFLTSFPKYLLFKQIQQGLALTLQQTLHDITNEADVARIKLQGA